MFKYKYDAADLFQCGSAAQCVMCSEQKQPSIKNIMFPAGIWTGLTVLGYITNCSYRLFLAERRSDENFPEKGVRQG